MNWINFLVMIFSSIMILFFYELSVSPAALEKRIGEKAYKRCGIYRIIGSVFMLIVAANYILYVFFPLSINVPQKFPWPWWVSIIIAIIIGIPSSVVMMKGAKDAGKETMSPQKDRGLYSGIYNYMRHPQGVGEVFLWWVIAFLCHSPFLCIYSFLFIPIWILMVKAEERDLILRYGDSYTDYLNKVGWFGRKK